MPEHPLVRYEAFYQSIWRAHNNKMMREARAVAALATKEERDAALLAIQSRTPGPAGVAYRYKVESFARMVFVAAKRSRAVAQPELELT